MPVLQVFIYIQTDCRRRSACRHDCIEFSSCLLCWCSCRTRSVQLSQLAVTYRCATIPSGLCSTAALSVVGLGFYSMPPLCYEHDVRLSVCNVGGLWSHSTIKSRGWYITNLQIGVLVTCMWKLTRIVVFCDSKSYQGRPVGYGIMCGILYFGDIQQFSCRAISASIELPVRRCDNTIPAVRHKWNSFYRNG